MQSSQENVIPSLRYALEEYYNALLPFITSEEAERIHASLEQYYITYHEELEQRVWQYISSFPDHYNGHRMIEEYCSIRESLPLTSNFGIHLHSFDPHIPYIEYASRVIYAMATLCHTIKEDHDIAPCFGVCKTPRQGRDEILVTTEPTHYIVCHASQCYAIPLYDAKGTLYSPHAIATILQQIICSPHKESPLLCSLSYMGSDIIAEYLTHLMRNQENKHSIETLQHSAFTIALCDVSYTQEHYSSIAYPMVPPIWAYTSCSLLLWKNNEVTGYFEHTCIDGTTAVHMLEALSQQYNTYTHTHDSQDIPQITPLHCSYTEEQYTLLTQYHEHTKAIYNSLTTHVLTFDIESIRNIYPADAFIQSMLQYALYSTDGYLSSVYEPVGMYGFQNGRVEVLRPISQESKALIEEVYRTKAWNDSYARNAFQEHKRRITLCKQGQYFSRYLYLLSYLTQGTHAHSLFTTKGFELLDNDYLVTSNIGSTSIIQHFFYMRDLPVHYNVGYMVQDTIATLCFTYNIAYVHMDRFSHACEEFYNLSLAWCAHNR